MKITKKRGYLESEKGDYPREIVKHVVTSWWLTLSINMGEDELNKNILLQKAVFLKFFVKDR